eukprot:Awhi_evm2s5463
MLEIGSLCAEEARLMKGSLKVQKGKYDQQELQLLTVKHVQEQQQEQQQQKQQQQREQWEREKKSARQKHPCETEPLCWEANKIEESNETPNLQMKRAQEPLIPVPIWSYSVGVLTNRQYDIHTSKG